MRLLRLHTLLVPGIFVLGALTGHLVRPPGGAGAARALRNPYDLAGQLEAGGLRLHCVATGPWGDAYLTEKDLPRDRLALLRRDPAAAGAWEGTVLVERDRGYGETDAAGWGRHGWRVGDFLFFGDPRLLHRIRECLSRTPPVNGP
jgi:hypothetical protein